MNKSIIIAISLFCIVALYAGEKIHFSASVYFSSIFIIIFSLFNIFREKQRPYSLYKIVFLFSFFFFGVAPLVQFNSNSTSYGARAIAENEYFSLNIIIIIILLFFKFTYSKFVKKSISKKNIKLIENYKIPRQLSFRQALFLLFLSLASFLTIFAANNFSIISLLIRGGELKQSVKLDSSSIALIVSQTVRPVAMISLFYYYIFQAKNRFFLFLLGLLAVLTNFPLGIARFAAAAMYIPFVLLMIPSFRKNNVFSLSLIGGLLFVFPFLNNFRNFTKNSEISLKLDLEMFNEGHFDSYQNFALILAENMVSWGQQLLGVFLFWVPRSVWPGKPVGSGMTLAHKIGLDWDNISANFFAEGYVNFGYFGIFLFALWLAYSTAKLDNMYWNVASYKKNNFFRVIYYILLGMLFFMLRGDLLSSFTFTIGFLVAAHIVFKTVTTRFK